MSDTGSISGPLRHDLVVLYVPLGVSQGQTETGPRFKVSAGDKHEIKLTTRHTWLKHLKLLRLQHTRPRRMHMIKSLLFS